MRCRIAHLWLLDTCPGTGGWGVRCGEQWLPDGRAEELRKAHQPQLGPLCTLFGLQMGKQALPKESGCVDSRVWIL